MSANRNDCVHAVDRERTMLTNQHVKKIANDIAVTNTDTGTPGASGKTMPPTAANSANTIDAAMVAPGEEKTRAAAAAGVINSDITKSAPTICTPCAAASTTSAAKTMQGARTGPPRPAATSGSTVANSNGR